MDRTAARSLAASTLAATGAYTVGADVHVYQGSLGSFEGVSPVAVVTSRALGLEIIARGDAAHPAGMYEVTNGLSVSIYVRKADGATGAADAEATLDTLVRDAAVALHATGYFLVGESSAAPDGFPLRLIDTVLYRVERIPLSVLEEG